jgi:enoyl-CoA hydratase/carnithine racemase
VNWNMARSRAGTAAWLSLRQLVDGEAHAPLLGPTGEVTQPLVVVDLGAASDPVLLEEARHAARTCERIVVGVRHRHLEDEPWFDLLSALDLTLTPEGAQATPPSCVALRDPAAGAGAIRAAAAASPHAAVALAQVLRATEQLDVRSALNVESFAYSALLGGGEFQRWLGSRNRRPVPIPGPEPSVIAERTDGTLQITLNRPARRNAYSRDLRDALVEALLVPALDQTVRRVVIAGAGPSFCSGGDLDEFGTTPDIGTAHFIRTSGGAASLLDRIADRTEVRVHGACVGAGIELPAFARRVIAQPGTTFRLPEIGMGLIPGAGGTVSIPRRIGRWRTLYLALSGITLDAITATRWGLVDETTDQPGEARSLQSLHLRH